MDLHGVQRLNRAFVVAVKVGQPVRNDGEIAGSIRSPLIDGARERVLVLIEFHQRIMNFCQILRVGLMLGGRRFDLGGNGAFNTIQPVDDL